MTSTVIALILFICLLVSLELGLRASSKVTMELRAAPADIEGLKAALVVRDKEVRYYAQHARAAEALGVELEELLHLADGRIQNLCEQLELSRKGRRHYYDEAVTNAEMVRTLNKEITALKLANFANLSDLTALTPLQQENKLDALCEVIKTLMQRDQLCDAAVASFGGRLSRAVQVYRKDCKARSDAQAESQTAAYHLDSIARPFLIPGLQHLMAGADAARL